MKELLYLNIRRRLPHEIYSLDYGHFSPWVVEGEVWTCKKCDKPIEYNFVSSAFLVPMMDCKCYKCIDRIFEINDHQCGTEMLVDPTNYTFYDWHKDYLEDLRWQETRAKTLAREEYT